jgi:hypothetical protein
LHERRGREGRERGRLVSSDIDEEGEEEDIDILIVLVHHRMVV